MYLKSLDIHGFKSFADKVSVVFLPPYKDRQSITAVVGPNGSGKSNISDAIRWVMGEQKMKTLRGKKSDDVIFAGSETRSKMGVASVTMTIDNRDHAADIPYEELVITRRMYRSGESEYLVNGSPVRLLDLQILLAQAQCGQGSYSIVGQGMIERMLLQSSRERKAFFDEASGIKELQIKRHQASLKLARTREHITQAEALLHEVSPRLKTLSRQVEKLEERRGLELSLREKQEVYFSTLWQQHALRAATIRETLKVLDGGLQSAEGTLKKIQEELAQLANAASMTESFGRLQDEYQTATKVKSDIERSLAVLLGKMQTEYTEQGKQNVAWLEQKLVERTGAETELDTAIIAAERDTKESERMLRDAVAALSALRTKHIDLTSKRRQLEERALESKHEERLFQAIGLRAVEAVLSHRQEFGEVFGVVAELGRVEKGFELALDVAAGANLSSLVVGDDEVASRCIQYLRREELGTATFLPMNKIRPRMPQDVQHVLGRKGVHGLATDLIEFDPQFVRIFSFVFGSTVVVDSLETAREIGIGSVRMVTVQGDLIEQNGSMKGGFRKIRRDGLSFAHQSVLRGNDVEYSAEEEKQVQTALDQVSADMMHAEMSMRDLESGRQVNEAKKQLLLSQKIKFAEEIANLKQELALHTMTPEEHASVMGQLRDEKQTLDQTLIEANQRVTTAAEALSTFQSEEEMKKQRVFALQDEMQHAQDLVNAAVQEKNTQDIELAKCETKQEDLGNELLNELRISPQALVERGAPIIPPEEIAALQQGIEKLKYQLTLIGGIDPDVVHEFEETKERHGALSGQLEDLGRAFTDLEGMVSELDAIMKKRRDSAFQAIRKEFKRYFTLLFEGGSADLIEIYGTEEEAIKESDESEESEEEVSEEEETGAKKAKKVLLGIDVVASPPGKKIKELQALSGGERTMASIALISAILKNNPAPFIVLDEVEAALDEANTGRFNTILRELGERSQCILITHNRATMHAADALYGVTMGNEGVSKLLSVKMAEAEAVVQS